MAVKTKTQIIADINRKIITNGDIKAVDTNAILKDILDCKELNEQSTTNLSTFSFQSTTPLIDNKGGRLSYSLRGIVDSFVNITFRIAILENNVNNLTFLHNDVKILEALKTIIEDSNIGSDIDFLVKIKRKQSTSTSNKFRIGSLNFNCTEKEFLIKIESQELNDNLFNGDQIFASFSIHCPKDF